VRKIDKSANYQITELGIDFVERKAKIKKKVWTYRGKVESFEGEEITIDSALSDKTVWTKDDYWGNRR